MKQLYWLNAALLAAHEVDAGYWREWETFQLPIGPGGFVLLHVAAFLLLLWGHGAVVSDRRSAIGWSTAVGLAGLGTAGVHGVLLWLGRTEFRSWTSLTVLGAIALVSLLQLAAARFESRARQRTAGRGPRVFVEFR